MIIIITVIVIFTNFSLKLVAMIGIETRNIQTYVIRANKLHTFYISAHWGLLRKKKEERIKKCVLCCFLLRRYVQKT